MITDAPAIISPEVKVPLKVIPPVVVFRIDQPFSTAVKFPVFVISKNSSFFVSLFSSNMNLLKIRSPAAAKLLESGSSSPGVGQGKACPSELIVLQSVTIFQPTKSTLLPSGSSKNNESPSPLKNQFCMVNTNLSPG